MSTYEAHRMTDPRLPFIFHYDRALPHHQNSRGNWHENPEILCFTKGTGIVALNERQFSVSPGDTVVINSNILHTIFPDGERVEYHCLIIDRAFCVENGFDPNSILFCDHIRDPELSELMEGISESYKKTDDPLRVLSVRTLALRLCERLCRLYLLPEREPHSETHLLSCIKQALGYIHTNYKSSISLDELSERVGLSKYYFAREFRRITGYTAVSYINLVRCEKARKLLSDNRLSINEVAEQCGFANQSYFSKIFFERTGMKPFEYRKKHLEDIS